MNPVLRRLLLLPVLAPLVAVAALALLNPRPAVALRLLIWSSPALPIGSWLAIAVAGGGLMSAAATSAALQSSTVLRRQVRVSPGPRSPEPGSTATAGPQRPPGAPPPTVEVPFRVIRRGATSSKPSEPEAATPAPVASAVGDGWSQAPSDDW